MRQEHGRNLVVHKLGDVAAKILELLEHFINRSLIFVSLSISILAIIIMATSRNQNRTPLLIIGAGASGTCDC